MKVSIVMPVYNGEKYIEYAIRSIINQSYENIQFILVDGGSTDNTMNIVEKYKEYFYLVVSERDNGMYDAINKGFSRSDGELMLWLNSDDYLFPEAIKTAVNLMKAKPKIKWLTGRNIYIDSNNNIRKIGCLKSINKTFIENGYHRGEVLGFIMQETTFWHRDLYIKAGNSINTDYKLASDYEIWTRFAKHETLYSLNTCLGAFRQHDTQLSGDIDSYEKECDLIKPISLIKKKLFSILKYPIYIYGLISKKNKIIIDKNGNFQFATQFATFM